MIDSAGDGLAKGVSTSVAALVEKVFAGVWSHAGQGLAAARTQYVVGFQEYVKASRERWTHVKTLLHRTEPVELSDAYEPATLLIGSRKVIIDDVYWMLREGKVKNILITATLGSGKSLTTRYLFDKFCLDVEDRIPVYIELRNVAFSNGGIVRYIHETISPFLTIFNEAAVVAGLKAGSFILIFNGFDEIPVQTKNIAETQIHKITSDYPNNIVVVSSRPEDSRFLAWHNFPEYRIAPLRLGDLRRLIDRVKYDQEEKLSFITRVNSELFNSHRELLENPLLATMMLLTYRKFRSIPSMMYAFYDTAFDVLYREHDAIKLNYDRDFKSQVSQEDFKKLFMTFSFFSYIEGAYSFTENSIRPYIEYASSYEEIDVSPDDFLYDLTSCLCLIIRDGDRLAFLHRSFQEFFCALFMSRRSFDGMDDLFDTLVTNSGSGQETIEMAYELDREVFEKKFLFRAVSKISGQMNSATDIWEICKTLGDKIIFSRVRMNLSGMRYQTLPDVQIARDGGASGSILAIEFALKHYGKTSKYRAQLAQSDWESAFSRLSPADDTLVVDLRRPITAGIKELAEKLSFDQYVIEMAAEVGASIDKLGAAHNQKQRIIDLVMSSKIKNRRDNSSRKP